MSLAEQFQNPIVCMDRNGNGYSRLEEFWDSMVCKPYKPQDDVPNTPSAATLCTVKKPVIYGSWSQQELNTIRHLILGGQTDARVLARIMNRTEIGVRRVAGRLIREQKRKQSQACD